MSRGVRWVLVGSVALLVLAGCGRSFFAEREAWRREAEEQCLKSGAVKEGPSVALTSPITGPGICGADFPLRVTALGDSRVLGYSDDLRPPGAIPQGGAGSRPPPGYPANTPFAVNPAYPSDTRQPVNPTYRGAPSPSASQSYPAYPRGAAPARSGDPVPLTPSGGYAAPSPGYGAPSYGAPVYGAPRTVPAARGTIEPYPAEVEQEDDEPAGYPPSGPATVPGGAGAPGRAPAYTPSPNVPLSPSRGRAMTGSISPAEVSPRATLACPIVSALDRWVTDSVQPAALRWFAQPVVEIRQISAYSCRGMNGQAGAKISEHAFGNALDVAAFRLADGHVVTVKGGWRGTPEEQGFLRDVQLAACEQFTTVLAPGSNAFHYDHIHVDLMRRASGRRICQPAAVPGEVVAAQARARYAGKGRGEPAITGGINSYAPNRSAEPRQAAEQAALAATARAVRQASRKGRDDPGEVDRDLPRAVPGED